MWIKAFKTGTHKSMNGVTTTFTTSDLDAIAAAYDPTTRKAPVVIGHPSIEDRAYGWITDAKRAGEYLLVKIEQVDQAFAKAVNDGAFKYVSLCLKPNKKDIKHLGVLGANPPAVEGLGELGFAYSADSEAGEAYEFGEGEREIVWRINSAGSIFQRIRDWFLAEKGMEVADQVVPQYELDFLKRPPEPTPVAYAAAPSQETPMSAQEKAELESLRARNSILESENQALKGETDTLRFAAEREADEAFVAQLREHDHVGKKGPRLTAAQVPLVTGILSGLRTAGDFAFAAEDGTTANKPAYEAFKTFLEGLPPALAYGEAATAETALAGDAAVQVEAKVAEKLKDNPGLAYGQALREVQVEFPDLARALAAEAQGGA